MQGQLVGKKIIIIIFILLLVSLFIGFTIYRTSGNKLQSQPLTLLSNNITAPSLPVNAQANSLAWQKEIVASGDTLSKIFARLHVPYANLKEIERLPQAYIYLAKLNIDQPIFFLLNNDHQIKELRYAINEQKMLYIKCQNNHCLSFIKNAPMGKVLDFKSVVIRHSLAAAAKSAGLTHKMYLQFLSVFHDRLNYATLHKGDRFAILYNEYYLNGKKNHPGNIMAAEVATHKKMYSAIRFIYPHHTAAYYAPNGISEKPLFIIPPLHYHYISSHFTFHRKDPILHVIRSHLGIDYAAQYGTPIHSIGSGKVVFVGRDDGYGNAVIIRYDRKYKALYGHMERPVKGLHVGERVKQGQVIGYVGSTGWSTGPHLHFEIYVDGKPHNPLRMRYPHGKAIPAAYAKQFHYREKILLNQLNFREQATK